jgi:hypothetical protein
MSPGNWSGGRSDPRRLDVIEIDQHLCPSTPSRPLRDTPAVSFVVLIDVLRLP